LKKYRTIFSGAIFLYVLLSIQPLSAQIKDEFIKGTSKVQYGFSLKSSFEFNTRPGAHINLRVGLNAGVATSLLWKNFYPSYNLELQLYNGGLGSMAGSAAHPRHYLSFDIINSFTGTFGIPGKRKHFSGNDMNNVRMPLYYFGNFCYPALENPFWNSISIGADFLNSLKDGHRHQRVGFVNLHFNNFQAGYVNDGGAPFDIRPVNLGDVHDRYYTTVVRISYHMKQSNPVDLLEISYCKFTGYSENAFEISHNLDLNYVHYADITQHYYIYGYWSFDIASAKTGLGISLKDVNDYPFDLQKLVHYGIYNPFHKSPYPRSSAIAVNYFSAKNFIPRR